MGDFWKNDYVHTGAEWPLGQSGGARAGADILLKWAGYPCSDLSYSLDFLIQ